MSMKLILENFKRWENKSGNTSLLEEKSILANISEKGKQTYKTMVDYAAQMKGALDNRLDYQHVVHDADGYDSFNDEVVALADEVEGNLGIPVAGRYRNPESTPSHILFSNLFTIINDQETKTSIAAGQSYKMTRSIIDAFLSLKKGDSFLYEVGGADLARLLGASQNGMLNEPSAGLSGDAKLILSVAGMVSVLVIVAMALNYSVKIEGSKGDAKGTIVFNSPSEK